MRRLCGISCALAAIGCQHDARHTRQRTVPATDALRMKAKRFYRCQRVLFPADAGAEDRIEGVRPADATPSIKRGLACLQQNALPGAFSAVNSAAKGRVDGWHADVGPMQERLLMTIDRVYRRQIAWSAGATDVLFGCTSGERGVADEH